jgi:hypothetical protein
VSVRDITADTVLAAIATGASTRDDLAQRFEVLSSSRFLTDALRDLGAVEDERGHLSAPIPRIRHCRTCGLKPWDAPDLEPGEFVCTCNTPIDDGDLMTARVVTDIAEVIREIDPDNRLPLAELSATLTNRLITFYGDEDLFAADIVAFVERTNWDKQLGAGALAELIVAEFGLDEVAR